MVDVQGAALPPSQELAERVVAELVAGGVRDVILAPGSRSAPMAYALAAAEAAGELRLRVVLDERSAGFVALGLAVATRRPSAVVVTSGSAVANLHPAVLEAAHQRVPLLVISGDRPVELVRRGGSQTTEHLGMFGLPGEGVAGGLSRPRASTELTAGATSDEVTAAVADVLAASAAPVRGPVHLNLQFADPLVPAGALEAGGNVRMHVAEARVRRPTGPLFDAGKDELTDAGEGSPSGCAGSIRTFPPPQTLVVAGDGADPELVAILEARGLPILAEPTVPGGLPASPVLLDALGPNIERVVVLGRPTLSRQQSMLLSRPGVEVLIADPPGRPWLDAPGADHLQPGDVPAAAGSQQGPGAEAWGAASERVQAELDRELGRALRGEAGLEGWMVARIVSRAVADDDETLVAGASMAIRHLDLARVRGARVVSNRGLAGIDGTVSTAVGHALAGRSRALLGDLTLQHDLGGLVRGRLEREIDLQIVVLADDGGSIFATLEHGRPEYAPAHDRVFATPQVLDLSGIAAAVGARHIFVEDATALARALGQWPAVGGGVQILEVGLRREGAAERHRAFHRRLVEVARSAGVGWR